MKTTINQRMALLSNVYGTQDKFAKAVGISSGSVSHFIKGISKPSFDVIMKIAESIPDLNCRWLLTGSGEMYGQSDELIKIHEALKRIEGKI